MVTKTQLEKLTNDRFGQLSFHYTGRHDCSRTLGPRGGVTENITRVRQSGSMKTWKTRPNDFHLPVKYGMYESAWIDQDNAGQFHLASECEVSSF